MNGGGDTCHINLSNPVLTKAFATDIYVYFIRKDKYVRIFI